MALEVTPCGGTLNTMNTIPCFNLYKCIQLQQKFHTSTNLFSKVLTN